MAAPPLTEPRPFAYTLHGQRVVDPYHWLEGSAAPESPDAAALDAEVGRWTDAQNVYARSVLDALPGRATVSAELKSLLSLPAWGTPREAGEWLFYSLRRGDEAQPVLYVQRGQSGERRELVNVNRLDSSGDLALDWYQPSRDGRYVAFGTYRAGDENTLCRVLETATGRWLTDEIAGRVDPVAWLDDGEHFLVRKLKDADDPYSGQVTLHRLGRPAADDPVLFEQYTEGPLATTWGPSPIVDPGGRWLVIAYYTGTDSNDLWFYDLDDWRATGKLVRRDLLVGERALTVGFIAGDTLFALTTHGASNKRVVAFDLDSERPEQFRELIAARDDAVIVDIAPALDRIVVDTLVSAQSRLEIFDRAGKLEGAVELPGIGSASIVTNDERSSAWLRFENFAEPPSLHRVDLTTRRAELWQRTELAAAADDPELVVKQIEYRSADGTRVPMFLVHRADLALDGTNPTILYGYGGFDISMTPAFLTAWRPWLTRGGVYAIANLRGGGERGAAWHQAGMLEQKQNVFDDFYAAADWLVANGYTRPDRLGVSGRSNGGLLTGVTITQRPELAAAAIVGVPLLDMLRYQHFLMARYWVPEYGSAEDPAQFEFLRAYSPYQNVVPGTAYPAVLLTAAENDSRVHALHARKMAAALQAATTSDPAVRPILLRVDRDVGHGPGKPLEDRIRDAADELLFMARQLGLEIR
ncbi:MAG TPA: prolyl oligopeptidase family serine peptidase [Gammaproteobacteria bacterium]|nr:prolyl oligopeptidase family serine peptidase [Gammaproteobacteria bacterium]